MTPLTVVSFGARHSDGPRCPSKVDCAAQKPSGACGVKSNIAIDQKLLAMVFSAAGTERSAGQGDGASAERRIVADNHKTRRTWQAGERVGRAQGKRGRCPAW